MINTNKLTDSELVTELFMEWAGVTHPGKYGLSGNPRAQRLDTICYKRFGREKWEKMWNEIIDEYTEIYDKYEGEYGDRGATKKAVIEFLPRLKEIVS